MHKMQALMDVSGLLSSQPYLCLHQSSAEYIPIHTGFSFDAGGLTVVALSRIPSADCQAVR